MSSDASSTPSALIASVVTNGHAPYQMFVVRALDGAGAFLGGMFLLEHGEEVELEVRAPGQEAIRIWARVSKIERGPEPGIRVRFERLDAASRAALARLGSTS